MMQYQLRKKSPMTNDAVSNYKGINIMLYDVLSLYREKTKEKNSRNFLGTANALFCILWSFLVSGWKAAKSTKLLVHICLVQATNVVTGPVEKWPNYPGTSRMLINWNVSARCLKQFFFSQETLINKFSLSSNPGSPEYWVWHLV